MSEFPWSKLRNYKWTDLNYEKVRNAVDLLEENGDSSFPKEIAQFRSHFRINRDKNPDGSPSLNFGELVLVLRDQVPPWLLSKGGKQLVSMASIYELVGVREDKRKEYLRALFRDEMTGGYRRKASLYEKVKTRTLGVSQRFVEKFVRDQEVAQLTRPVNKEGRVVSPIITKRPMEMMQVDLIDLSRFPYKNVLNHTVILVCIDLFSKYVLLRPLRTKESTNVALAFKNILHNGFVPEVVQSDAGSEFKGGPFQEICRRHGIKQKFGTAGKPNTQGGVERVNGTIKRAVFADFIQKNNTDFSRSLSEIQFCYNTTKHSTTQLSPHQVLFGMDINNQVRFPQAVSSLEVKEVVDEAGVKRGLPGHLEASSAKDFYVDVPDFWGLEKGDIEKAKKMFEQMISSQDAEEVVKQHNFYEALRKDRYAHVHGLIKKNAEKMVENAKKPIMANNDLSVGDLVRVSLNITDRGWYKTTVERRFNWSRALFMVREVVGDDPLRYRLMVFQDSNGEIDQDQFDIQATERGYARHELLGVGNTEKGVRTNFDPEDVAEWRKGRRGGEEVVNRGERFERPAGVDRK